MNNRHIFTGFSTIGAENTKNWTIYDVELIKRDLYNHFNTRIGERVMRPEFGCRVWDYLMEPFNETIKDLIYQEVIRVCNADSRVSLQNSDILSYDNGIRIEITLYYEPLDMTDTFLMDFNNRQLTFEGQN